MSTRLARRSVTRTAAYTLAQTKGDFSGTCIDTIGAAGSLTFTLPPAKVAIKGWWYEFLVGADQSLIVAAANAGEIIAGTSLSNDNVGFQIASKKIGGRILVLCTGTKWVAIGQRTGGGFCIGGTEVIGDDLVTAGTVTASRQLVVDANKDLVGIHRMTYTQEVVHASQLRETKSADTTVAAADSGYLIDVDTDAKIMTLPATVVGMTFTFVNAGADGAVLLSVSPNAADKIIGAGFTAADNKDAQNTKATAKKGDYIRLVGDGVDGWFVQEMRGTWVREA